MGNAHPTTKKADKRCRPFQKLTFDSESPSGSTLRSLLDKKVLLIVPDATRTAPLPLLFDAVHGELTGVGAKVDVMIALGTHPGMPDDAILKLLGISDEDRAGKFADVGLFNHEWDNPDALTSIGELTKADVEEISDGLLSLDVDVQINAKIRDYDTLLVLGPVFPHEVVGFSGGNKYFFPGISGPDLLNFFHWLGALITNVGIIGVKDTPVRRVVDRAATLIPVDRRALTFVVNGKADIYDLFYGTPEEAWDSAADVSAQVHIERVDKPFKQVLSCAPLMYDELWVAGKCMYKLESVVADGGELIIYAPHLDEISTEHGKVHFGDRLPHSRLLPEAVGRFQALPLGSACSLDTRSGNRHV